MIRLSAVIIAYNEEKNIGDCINSLKEIADEIIVVSSFSTDKTEEIAQQKNARVIRHAFEGHIEQKNFALSQAANDYVLSLDADERLSEDLKQSILKVKSNWAHDGYTMNRLNNYCGKWIKHGDWYPDRKLRLWNRIKGKWGGENPHDKVVMQDGATVSRLKGNILHYTVTSIKQYEQQLEKYSSIAAEVLYRKGKTSSKLFAFVNAGYTFFRNYFLKLGCLDGYYGWIISRQLCRHNYMKYSKLVMLHKKRKP